MRELDVAIELAREAGRAILEVYAEGVAVERKDGHEPVTIADRRADALIRRGLIDAFPADGLLSEETPDDLERLTRPRLWLVDPLDGTKQFIQQIPEFSVMIGLAVEGHATLGVVHMPVENVTYAAAEGLGCRRIDAEGRSHTLTMEPFRGTLRDARYVMSRSLTGSRTGRVLESISPAPALRSGSVGRKAALVARGEADAYFTLSTRSRHWDACAAEVIVREAGGVFSTALGEKTVYNIENIRNHQGLMACRRGLEEPLVEALAESCGH